MSLAHNSAPSTAISATAQAWTKRFHTLEIIFLHLLMLLVPFIFTWVNEELFEFNKMMLTFVLVAGVVVCWLAQMILRRQLLWKRTPLDIPLGLFVISQIISTVLSIHPYTSLYGYYSRFHGSLLSTLAYVALYYAVVSSLNKKEVLNLLRSMLLGGLGAALYAIPEHFGISPSCVLITNGQSWNDSCWIQDVHSRVFGTFGQPNWLAAYAITLLPPSLIYFWEGWREHLGMTKIQNVSSEAILSGLKNRRIIFSALISLALLLVLLFTKSRSGMGGLAVGVILMAVGVIYLWRRKLLAPAYWQSHKIAVTLALIAGIASVAWFGTPWTPSLSSLAHKAETTVAVAPSGDSQLDSGGTESLAIRKIVWAGAIKVWERYPIFGSGVETFAYSYYQDRPLAHNTVSEWDFLYNKAHSEELQFLATTGIVGLVTYLGLLVWFGWWTLRTALPKKTLLSNFERLLLLSLVAGVLALSVSNFFGFSTVMVSVIMFSFFALAAVLGQSETKLASSLSVPPVSETTRLAWWQIGLLVLVVLAGLNAWWSTANWWLADYDYSYSKKLFTGGYLQEGLSQITTAINRRPYEALYYDQLASDYAQLAVAYSRDQDASTSAQLSDAAVAATQETLALNPRHLNFYKSQARIYITLAELHPEYLAQAHQALATATKLAPTDPKVRYNLGLVEEAEGDFDTAQHDLELAVQLKPDYQDARLELADVYQKQKNYSASAEQYQYVLEHIAPNEPSVLEKLQNVEASASAAQKPK